MRPTVSKLWACIPLLIVSLTAASCAAPRSAWTPLSPLKNRSATSVQKAEQTAKGVTVAVELLERKDRYVARVEIRNDSAKTIRAPGGITLSDGRGLLQTRLDKDQLRDEISRQARSDAYLARSSYYYGSFGPRYYYGPRRYRHRRYGTSFYYAPYYRDDWFEREIEARRIVDRANRNLSTLESGYLTEQDIPAGASLRGFVQFAKTGSQGLRSGGLMTLSIKAGRKAFNFEFQ